MSFISTTDLLIECCESILHDMPKAMKGNKSAAQRIRTGTVRMAKVSKEWRKLSLDRDKKITEKKKTLRRKK